MGKMSAGSAFWKMKLSVLRHDGFVGFSGGVSSLSKTPTGNALWTSGIESKSNGNFSVISIFLENEGVFAVSS